MTRVIKNDLSVFVLEGSEVFNPLLKRYSISVYVEMNKLFQKLNLLSGLTIQDGSLNANRSVKSL